MGGIAILAARVLTPIEELPNAVVLIEDGRIRAVGRREGLELPRGFSEYDAGGLTVTPGFVDIHIHGAGGHDVMEPDVKALHIIAYTAARHGTTAIVATTMTASTETTCRGLETLARYIHSLGNQRPQVPPAAELLGIHLEGPFISPAKRGVHPAESIVAPSAELLDRLLEAARGGVRLLTLAPEMPGALELIEHAQQRGLVVSMGHTDATYDQARAAIERGARHAAHVFNAMRPFAHRETGVIGAILTSPEVTAEVIADGIHVDSPAIRLLVTAKGAGGVLLVSDGTAATGMPDGNYKMGTLAVTVTGGVSRDAQGRLAGSTLTLDRAVRHMTQLGMPLPEAVRMATLNPARRLGLEKRKGVLAPGADADLVFLREDLHIAGVMTRGVGVSGKVGALL